MTYASKTSPFASIKGQNIFSSKPSTSIFAGGPQPVSQRPGLAPAFGTPSTLTPTPKRSGFEAFASPSSPFASLARAKSPFSQGSATPMLGRAKSPPASLTTSAFAASPFASYVGSSHVFGLPAQNRRRGESPNGHGSPTKAVFGQAEHDSGDEAHEDEDDESQSFSEKLRRAKDDEYEDEEKPTLTEQDGMHPRTLCCALFT